MQMRPIIAMAGGYTQAELDPAVIVVHLGAGRFFH
jgi:hypothetical protein